MGLAVASGQITSAETDAKNIFSDVEVGTLQTRDVRVNMKDAIYSGQIGFLTVPEVRADDSSNKIKIAFLHIYSKNKQSAAPIFRFHGGPDNEAQLAEKLPFTFMESIDFSQQSSDVIEVNYDIAYLYYSRYLEFADLVLMDGRGMGLSEPRLTCPRPPEPVDLMQEREETHRRLTKVLQDCRGHFQTMGINFAGYNLVEVADDIDALRMALGFEKIALHGASFGTQTALAYLQRYDANVTAASLVGIEGLDATYDVPSEIQAATEQAFKIANANPDVAAMMPKGDMKYAIQEIYRELDEQQRIFSIQPKGSEPFDILFNSHAAKLLLVANGLVQNRGDGPFARSAGAARIPPLVAALYHKAYEGITRIVEKNYDGFRDMVVLNAAANVIDCASGISADRLERLTKDTENPDNIMMGALSYVGLQERNPGPLCHIWAVDDLGDEFRAPFKTDVPLLIVNGTFDGITPAGNARRLHAMMPNSRMVMVENSGHYATEIYHFDEEFHQLSAEFLRTGQFPAGLKETVTLPPIKYDTLSWGVMLLFKLGLGNHIM
ncbi:MAG: alpha/beta fold hydrolase [Kordiimonadaceae bacterium]|nr:alpha/beta fold hydrolase [Kordiimonadaceae bacterium]